MLSLRRSVTRSSRSFPGPGEGGGVFSSVTERAMLLPDDYAQQLENGASPPTRRTSFRSSAGAGTLRSVADFFFMDSKLGLEGPSSDASFSVFIQACRSTIVSASNTCSCRRPVAVRISKQNFAM